jgi:AcrR family transcriptional regulator
MCAEKRRDAQENEARIVRAAAEVFAEQGLDAPIPTIAERAHVGKGTVYRNFPTKTDLVAAIALDRLETIAGQVDRACATEDAWAGFVQLLEDILILQAKDRALGDALRRAVREDVLTARTAIVARMQKLLERAAADGKARRDASARDVRHFLSGIAGELTQSGVRDLDEWRRYARLIADAFAARSAERADRP